WTYFSCHYTLSMTEDDQRDSDQTRQLIEDVEQEQRRRDEMKANFPLALEPYDDDEVLDDLPDFIKDPVQDFQFIVHAHLLSLGTAEGWEMDILRAAVKESMKNRFKDVKDVDKYVQDQFQCATLKQFIRKASEIAVVDENGRVHPNLDDDDNRELYEDAQASVQNKGEKERKHDEKIAKKLVDPENVEGFYRGVNRLRRAIRQAIIVHGGKANNAITEINAMDGTGDIINAINYSFVATEYEKLYERKLDADECKLICGRSTLNKGLLKGEGATCFIETFAMANKGAMYIGVKNTSREYTEADIQAEVEKCKQTRAQADKKVRRWQEKERRWQEKNYPRAPVEKTEAEKERIEKQRRMLEQLEAQALPVSSDPTVSSVPAPSKPSPFATIPRADRDYLRQATGGGREFGDDKIEMPLDDDSEAENTDDFQEYSDEEDNTRAEKRRKKAEWKKKKLARKAEAEKSSMDPSPDHQSSSAQEFADEEIEQDFQHLSTSSTHNANQPVRSSVGQKNRWDDEEPSAEQTEDVRPQQGQQRATRSVFAPLPVPDEVYHRPQQGQQLQPSYQEHQQTLQRRYDQQQKVQHVQPVQQQQPAARRGIGQTNRWDMEEPSEELTEEEQVQQPQQHQQQRQYEQQQPIPCSPSPDEQSSLLLGDSTMQQDPMNPQQTMQQQYWQPGYAPGPYGPLPPAQPVYGYAYYDLSLPEQGGYYYNVDPAFHPPSAPVYGYHYNYPTRPDLGGYYYCIASSYLAYQQQQLQQAPPPMQQPMQQPGFGPAGQYATTAGYSGCSGGPGPRRSPSEASSSTMRRAQQAQRDGLEDAFRERQGRYGAPPPAAPAARPAAAPAAQRGGGGYYDDKGEDLWRSHVNKLNTPRRRIRWQVISILKNMRDKNEKRLRGGREEDFELIEINQLAELVMMGCGNEMELYEAAQELDMNGDDLFFNFIRDMESDGLLKLYRKKRPGKFRNAVVTKYHENIAYVMDPHLTPPANLGLSKC
ncbi:hypothetical protein PENTCL1PPCAC_4054, partial [Pristionchus entomophagus]